MAVSPEGGFLAALAQAAQPLAVALALSRVDADADAVAVADVVDVGLAVLVHGSSEAVVVTDGELE